MDFHMNFRVNQFFVLKNSQFGSGKFGSGFIMLYSYKKNVYCSASFS